MAGFSLGFAIVMHCFPSFFHAFPIAFRWLFIGFSMELIGFSMVLIGQEEEQSKAKQNAAHTTEIAHLLEAAHHKKSTRMLRTPQHKHRNSIEARITARASMQKARMLRTPRKNTCPRGSRRKTPALTSQRPP